MEVHEQYQPYYPPQQPVETNIVNLDDEDNFM